MSRLSRSHAVHGGGGPPPPPSAAHHAAASSQPPFTTFTAYAVAAPPPANAALPAVPDDRSVHGAPAPAHDSAPAGGATGNGVSGGGKGGAGSMIMLGGHAAPSFAAALRERSQFYGGGSLATSSVGAASVDDPMPNPNAPGGSPQQGQQQQQQPHAPSFSLPVLQPSGPSATPMPRGPAAAPPAPPDAPQPPPPPPAPPPDVPPPPLTTGGLPPAAASAPLSPPAASATSRPPFGRPPLPPMGSSGAPPAAGPTPSTAAAAATRLETTPSAASSIPSQWGWGAAAAAQRAPWGALGGWRSGVPAVPPSESGLLTPTPTEPLNVQTSVWPGEYGGYFGGYGGTGLDAAASIVGVISRCALGGAPASCSL